MLQLGDSDGNVGKHTVVTRSRDEKLFIARTPNFATRVHSVVLALYDRHDSANPIRPSRRSAFYRIIDRVASNARDRIDSSFRTHRRTPRRGTRTQRRGTHTRGSGTRTRGSGTHTRGSGTRTRFGADASKPSAVNDHLDGVSRSLLSCGLE